jgi:RND superfamily putative drug exporter
MKNNLAARIGGFSARHWILALLGWVALVAALVVAGSAAGQKQLTDAQSASGESARAERIIAAGRFKSHDDSETIYVSNAHARTDDPAFRSVVVQARAALRGLPDVVAVKPHTTVAPNGHALVFEVDRTPGSADTIGAQVRAMGHVEAAHPGYTVRTFGEASVDKELSATLDNDFSTAERETIPVSFLILLATFGVLLAALIPLLLAFSAVLAAIGLAGIVSHVVPMSDAANSVALLIGMAVGVDYTLFYLRREREEREAGASHLEAIHRAAATSGQAVLISGLTVIVAMAGMLLSGNTIFVSLGLAAMGVVAIAVIGSVVALPALLAAFRGAVDRSPVAWLVSKVTRVDEAKLRFVRRFLHGRDESRLWGPVLGFSMRRPWAAALASTAVLVVLALPVLDLHMGLPGFGDFPHQLHSVQTYEAIQHAFPGKEQPAVVAIHAADVTAPPVRRAIAGLEREARQSGEIAPPFTLEVSTDRHVAELRLPLAGAGQDAVSEHALGTLRHELIPATLGRVPGVEAAVTGETAGNSDFNARMSARIPLVIGFVLLLAFVLLLVSFRSIVVPLKAIVLNLLSVAASYGVLVACFQWGWGEGLLGFQAHGFITSWLPLFLFVILFGLSMDYHVFILSRIKELVDGGMATKEAVDTSIRSTAGTVTSAAFVMVAVFAVFATLQTIDIKQMGVGLAVAIALDATLVRGVLLPATMVLLGERNWYLPRWLAWLPGGDRRREATGELVPAGAEG